MENYERVRAPRRSEDNQTEDNEVRISSIGKPITYIAYATTLFNEKEMKSIVIRATGKAINKAVAIAEIIKRRFVGLHQNITIDSTEIVDIWEPKEPGLESIETKRPVAVISITLSKDPLDTSTPGYQPPLPEEECKPLHLDGIHDGDEKDGSHRRRGGRGRGRGRGRRGGFNQAAAPPGLDGDQQGETATASSPTKNRRNKRGRGRGRGKANGEETNAAGATESEVAPVADAPSE